MNTFELPITAAEYRSNLAYLRAETAKDRTSQVSSVRVSNSSGRSVQLFIRHSDLWIVGIDFGQGPHGFSDMPRVPGWKQLEFTSAYGELGLVSRSILISKSILDQSIEHLSYHRVSGNGSRMFDREKNVIVRLVFVVSEALRNWKIEQAIVMLLNEPAQEANIKDSWGNGKPLNEWATWSSKSDWPARGIFLPHIPTSPKK